MRPSCLLTLLFLSAVLFAPSIEMLMPYKANLSQGDEINFGIVGPGQTFSASFWPKVTTGGTFGKGGYYDYAYADVPAGWETQPSDLYGRPLFLTITAPPTAKEGEYALTIHIIDEGNYEHLGNITLRGVVQVKKDVFEAWADKAKKEGTIYTNLNFTLYVKNKADAGAVFVVKSLDPKHPFEEEFYVPPQSTRSVVFAITSKEEETYHVRFIAYPKYCPNINKTIEITAAFRPSLLGDIKALHHGIVIFPYALGLIYSFLALLGKALQHL